MPALTHSACQVLELCRKSFLINDLANPADRTEASAACQIHRWSTSILYRSRRRCRNINKINALSLTRWHKFRIQAQTISMALRSGTRKWQAATRAQLARSRPTFRRAGPGAGRAPRCIPGLVFIFWARLRSLAVKGDVAREDLHAVLQLAAEGKLRCHTEVQALDQVNQILERMRRGQINGRAVLICRSAHHSH
jgi:hypothetical protein